jgi:hypothetical protein
VPVITIRNGTRTLKLTKREENALLEATRICGDINAEYQPLKARRNANMCWIGRNTFARTG